MLLESLSLRAAERAPVVPNEAENQHRDGSIVSVWSCVGPAYKISFVSPARSVASAASPMIHQSMMILAYQYVPQGRKMSISWK